MCNTVLFTCFFSLGLLANMRLLILVSLQLLIVNSNVVDKSLIIEKLASQVKSFDSNSCQNFSQLVCTDETLKLVESNRVDVRQLFDKYLSDGKVYILNFIDFIVY